MYKTPLKRKRARHVSEYDISGDIEKIKMAIAETGADIRGRAGEILWESLDGVKTKFDDAKERSMELQETVSERIADKPFKSVGIAMLAGACIGFLLRR